MSGVGRRRRLARAFLEMHYQLRTEAGTPLRKALSVGLGVLVGSTPFYGFHLTLCVALATLFGLNRIHAYLASHINNPITMPLFLYVEFGTGHWLRNGTWPALRLEDLRQAGALELGYDLAVGTVLVGSIVAIILTSVAYLVSRLWMDSTTFKQLLEDVSRRYADSGIRHWEYVRGKLRYDPFYLRLLRANPLPGGGRLVDLACGRGILLALLRSAEKMRRHEDPMHPVSGTARLLLTGVESRQVLAGVARAALGGDATIESCSPDAYEIPPSQAIVIMDFLHTLPVPSQERVVARAAAALSPGGLLIVRDVDRTSGLRFHLGRVPRRMAALLAGRGWPRFHYRSRAAWRQLLEQQGLSVRERSGWARRMLGDVLLEARKPSSIDGPGRPAPVPTGSGRRRKGRGAGPGPVLRAAEDAS